MAGLTSSPEEAVFRQHGSSLAMYRPIPELQDFWQDHWSNRSLAEVLAKARTGDLGAIGPSVRAFLPQDGLILEAGCGTGMVVQALDARGYDVVGVDYAAGTVRDVKAVAPELVVEVGDITALRWADNTFAGYLSLGVMEHFYEGPDAALAETLRVLRPGGIALISVPYKNFLRARRWRKVSDADGSDLPGDWRFYQDHVDVAGFERLLLGAGFEVVDIRPYGLYAAILRDSVLLAAAERRGWLRHPVRKLLKLACNHAPRFVRLRHSHMMMFVCRKPVSNAEKSCG